ncbi:glutamate racemase [Ktedonosporobacter rubrisoli]|uniref:Glutamate racemase n=1 Tax=Ktedonosporobacter rubrisoli TaxID=2509675 RepID=A0A4P6K0L0_KTERU|nr:glutamate racemase [Ktedonosporobacter rubrisoli]QBD81343.1 glutamate racemase [Ktedonosporobacter rubrisoli]
MKYWSSDDEAETHVVYPARDAERSDHAFNDKSAAAEAAHFSTGSSSTTLDRSLAPIGVFDSGVGGLTILSALQRELPGEAFIYFGDTAHCPYGSRSEAEITALAVEASSFLLEQGAKLIVVACNTASQAALNTLRATFSVPFVGVVPAIKPAARTTKRGSIGVVATSRAAQAAYLQQLIDDFAAGLQVYAVGCPELVTLVEGGEFAGPRVETALHEALDPLLARNIDVLVLGCTHFPALRSTIERIVGKQVQVIDSGAAIARRTHSILDSEGLTRSLDEPAVSGLLKVYCSGEAEAFGQVASQLLGYPVDVQQIHMQEYSKE